MNIVVDIVVDLKVLVVITNDMVMVLVKGCIINKLTKDNISSKKNDYKDIGQNHNFVEVTGIFKKVFLEGVDSI